MSKKFDEEELFNEEFDTLYHMINDQALKQDEPKAQAVVLAICIDICMMKLLGMGASRKDLIEHLSQRVLPNADDDFKNSRINSCIH